MTKTKTIKKTTKDEAEVSIKKEEKKESSNVFRLDISVNDIMYKTEGESIKECLLDFINSPVYPFGAKTKLFINCSKGKLNRHRIFNTKAARKVLLTMKQKDVAVDILASKLTRELE